MPGNPEEIGSSYEHTRLVSVLIIPAKLPVRMSALPHTPRWSFFPRLLGLGALLLAGSAGLTAGEWQSLLDNTPFGQAPVNAPSPTGELEFRGVVQEEGVYLVNLYNPTTKTAQWIPVNGSVAGLEVKSYDAGSDKVQITQAGRPLTLSLKQARVALVAAPVPAPQVEPPGNPDTPDKENLAERRAQVREMIRARLEGRGPDGQPPQFMRNMPPEAQAMIEEFRRRRAEAAANRSGGQPQPQPQPRQR